jgi:hypothetical protein
LPKLLTGIVGSSGDTTSLMLSTTDATNQTMVVKTAKGVTPPFKGNSSFHLQSTTQEVMTMVVATSG